MPIRKLTPQEEAAKELKDKSPLDYIKEGKTPEEARALVEAIRAEDAKAEKEKTNKTTQNS